VTPSIITKTRQESTVFYSSFVQCTRVMISGEKGERTVVRSKGKKGDRLLVRGCTIVELG